jgi:hypothetical protein
MREQGQFNENSFVVTDAMLKLSEAKAIVIFLGHLQIVLKLDPLVKFFLEEFLVGHELKFLLNKVNAHLIHSSCLAHSRMTKNTKKVHNYPVHCFYLSQYLDKCVNFNKANLQKRQREPFGHL